MVAFKSALDLLSPRTCWVAGLLYDSSAVTDLKPCWQPISGKITLVKLQPESRDLSIKEIQAMQHWATSNTSLNQSLPAHRLLCCMWSSLYWVFDLADGPVLDMA